MRKAAAGECWELTARVDGAVLETLNARELLREIAEATWQCGDPGMQFDTACNDWHTRANTDRNYATNPCSEFVSLDNTACNLASLNLMRFVDPAGDFETARFASAVRTLITAQEILVGYADYPTDTISVNARANRELGLGYANLGALLMYRGVPYDSDAGRAYAASVTALMTGEAYAHSARIAEVLGAYKEYEHNRDPHDRVVRMHRDFAYRIRDELVPASLLSAARPASRTSTSRCSTAPSSRRTASASSTTWVTSR